MTSEQKLREIRFFFERINEYYKDSEKCEYCVSAFLSASFSLFDHTLQEYNLEFHLKIPRTKLDIKSFYEAAKANNNERARGFIELFASEYLKIVRNPICAALLTMRNINTHETTNLTPEYSFVGEDQAVENQYLISKLENYLHSFKPDLIGWLNSRIKFLVSMKNELKLDIDLLSDSEANAVYSNAVKILSETELQAVCQDYVQTLEKFVTIIRAKYPRW